MIQLKKLVPVLLISQYMKAYKMKTKDYVMTEYKNICKKLKFKENTLYSLRHTFATRAVEVGFEIKSLSEILGHSNINITLESYVHSSMVLKRANMEKLANLSM